MLKIEGAKYEEIELLMNLFCTGVATLSQKQLDCLLSVANQLDLDISKFDLKEIDTVEYITSELQDNRSLNKQNVVTTELCNPMASTNENSSFRMCECKKIFKSKVGYEQVPTI